MGQSNSNRVSHNLESLPNTFRDDQLHQILNDIDEELTGMGFSELVYSGVFISGINVYTDATKVKKRTDVVFTYEGVTPFLQVVTRRVYDEDTGLTVVATSTATITYNPNRTVKDVTVVDTRP